jgi:hypothetical protein
VANAVENLCNELAEQTDNIINARLKKAAFDKTYIGVITEILFDYDTPTDDATYNKYKVFFNSGEQDIYITDGNFHAVGEKVKIIIPINDLKNKYVLCENHKYMRDVNINKTQKTISFAYDKDVDDIYSHTYNYTTEPYDITVGDTTVTVNRINKITTPYGQEVSINVE